MIGVYPLASSPATGYPSTASRLGHAAARLEHATTARKQHSYCSNPALIQACVNGDQGAWNELVERYGRLVYSIPLRSGLSETDADDVFQNVFTIVLRSLESLRDQTRLSAWLITTTHRECWRLAKRSKPYDELDEELIDTRTSASEQVHQRERHECVREAISHLDPPCRELVTFLFLDASDPTYEEIARRLDMAVGSVGPTRARCFKKLEAILIKMEIDLEL